MKNYTTYFADRKSFAVRASALLMGVSLIARIVCGWRADSAGVMVVAVRILLPAAANLFFALLLLLRADKQFYVTRVPVILFAVYFLFRITDLEMSSAMTALCIVLCILQCTLYDLSCRGYSGAKAAALISMILPAALFFLDGKFRMLFSDMLRSDIWQLIADCAIVLGVVIGLSASKAMAPWKEGDPYRLRPGDRLEGRKVRNRNPMDLVAGYIMPYRNGASNFIMDSIEVSNMESYIHRKRREGLRHFGITHVFLAAYVRCCAELPALNRFFAGQKVYTRDKVIVSMMVKREMDLHAKETLLKVAFDPSDTADEIYRKYDAALQDIRDDAESGFDDLVGVLNAIPGLALKFAVWCLTVLDYFGFMPKVITEFSPFHASMFITSMGSLGIPPIVHHLYNFGNVPAFCSFGAKKTVREIDQNGKVVTKKYVDYTWNTDERICDGHYYATVMKRMKVLMSHPEKLDVPPEEVKKDVD